MFEDVLRLRHLIAMAFVTVVLGCAAPPKAHWAGQAPPAPASEAVPAPVRQFDYTHKVLHPTGARPGQRHTIAIVRFGDTKDIEDVPFGPERPAQDSQTGDVNVAVNIGTRTEEPERARPQMTRRSREMLKHALMESEAFVVVERERILDILREINFSKTRYVDPETAPQDASLVAVRYLLEGSLGLNEDQTLKGNLPSEPKYEELALERPGFLENIFNPARSRQRRVAQFKVWQARMAREGVREYFNIACYISAYDVHTGEIVTSVMGLGANRRDAIEDAVEELVVELAERGGEIRVAAVRDDRVYVEAGKHSGLAVGTRLQVIHPGERIRDQNGMVIGFHETEVGEVEVVEVHDLYSIATPITTSQALRRGDVVRPAKH